MVVIDLVGVDPGDVPAILRSVAQEQLLLASFRPVIVLDVDRLGDVRAYGFPVELTLGRDAWPGLVAEWEEHTAKRLIAIRRYYRAIELVTLSTPADTWRLRMLAT
ncbi:hypothetical protein GCG21_11990 [Pseudactinotalea sp. HY160]|uniref:hypothetical protein n=1 Tax=Pseudactinotalea sp. HY160 TaxID=2654490 RepID=UPI00128BBA28|nr:hypothetical protein [Pseudactinotalea sp. HY160]MPV50713.1 hypothetical protein [Pseudactinotalea sp. HY160]